MATAYPLAGIATNMPGIGAGRSTGAIPGYLVIHLGRGHYNRLCLAATIAGKKGLMLVDTGAGNTALNDASYRALIASFSQTLPAGVPKTVSMNGLVIPVLMAPDFYLGGVNVGAFPVPLIPRRYLSEETPLDRKYDRLYDGVLGENILRHYNAVVDCGRLALYLNTDPARKLKLTSAFLQNGWTRIPMSDFNKDFTVPCVLNGQKFRLLVDTGAPFTALDRDLARGAQVNFRNLPTFRSGLIGTQKGETGLVDLNSLQIGAYTALNVHMITSGHTAEHFTSPNDHSSDGPIIGLLGGDTLAANFAMIDIGNKALYLKRTGTSQNHGSTDLDVFTDQR